MPSPRPVHRARGRGRSSLPLSALLLACSAKVTPARAPLAHHTTPIAAADAGVADAGFVDASAAPPVVSATDRVRASLASLPTLAERDSAWIRERLLAVVISETRAMPAPTRPEARDGANVWTLVADVETDPDAFEGLCDAVLRRVPGVACATDAVPWSGAERARAVFGWRGPLDVARVSFAQPLLALGVAPELCLVRAERTLRTLDMTVRAPDHASLGRALALMTVTPSMSDLILVRAEPVGAAVEAVLSWPLARASGEGDLGDRPWPTRCDGRSTVGAEALAGTVPIARERVRGPTPGAVLRVGRREWVVTTGDAAASVDVIAVREAGVTVRMRGRVATATLRFPAR